MAVRQLRLIPSGVSACYRDTIAATHDAFAYSSTMALHIYRLKDNTLHKMFAAHERAISSICWSPEDTNLLASCSVNGRVAIWDLEAEEERFATKLAEMLTLMDWAPSGDKIVLMLENGDVRLWEYNAQADKVTTLFKAENGSKVLRWHPRIATKLVVGQADGSILVYDQPSKEEKVIVGKSKTSKDPVTDAQWDPLSDDYLLVAFQDGSLSLYDAGSQRELVVFDKQAQGIRCLAWAKSQPGNFVSATERVGVLRLWNVSQRSPLMQIKVGHSGINCMKAVPSEPNWFVLSFQNGAVGVVDIATKIVRFTSTPGHSETIFDCGFHPANADMLATASYDGYVKLWETTSGESSRELYAGKDQLLYGLAFGPGASRLCAVSSTGVLFVWRTDSSEQILRLQVHTGQAYRVEWNSLGQPDGDGQIVTGGADGFACVTDATSGSIIQKLQHPGPVIGVAWHLSEHLLLATACQDGNVRVFRLAAQGGDTSPVYILRGHESRVFNVAWHPLLPRVLASGSDDKSIRVWNCQAEAGTPQELRKLTGHTSYVRGILWHTELPGILFSGSWDSTIRVWDVLGQTCLHVAHEHHADVYGLALHPSRPFCMVSSSRDTTLRFWIFEDLVRPLLVHAIARPDRVADLLGNDPSEIMTLLELPPGSLAALPLKLYGQASRALVQSLGAVSDRPSVQDYQRIISFFMYRHGIEDLWGLISIARGEPSLGAPAQRSVFHERELITCQKSKALEMAAQRGQVSIQAGKYEDRLLKAAQIMLRIGDLKSYCRLVAQAGQWERAICIAPAVSHQFWAELCAEYTESLGTTTDMDESAPFWVATGRASTLIDAHIERNELDSAFVVAKASSDGLLPSAPAAARPEATLGTGDRSRLQDVADVLSRKHSDLCEPLQSAMCFLAIDQPARAVDVLSRSHEVVLAYVVADLLGQAQEPVTLQLLAKCAERDQRWALAADVWRRHPTGLQMQLPLLAARCPDKAIARGWMYHTPEQEQERLQAALAAGDHAAATLAAVCAGDSARAAQVGVEGLHALFVREGWTIAEARALLDPLESLPLQDMGVKDIAGVLSCAAYVGLVEACSLGYSELIFPLAQTLRNIIAHQNLSFPVTIANISFLEATSTSRKNPQHALQLFTSLLGQADLPAHLRPLCEQHMATIGQHPSPVQDDGRGLFRLSGAHLPTCYRRHAKTSVLTSQLIRGPAFALEDKSMNIALSDALAWTRVNAFSPLNTGCKMCPV